jgi:hypothetical protein
MATLLLIISYEGADLSRYTYICPTTRSSVFSLSNIFTATTVVSPYSTYHHLMTRAQTTVINWCKEQLYIPLFIFCINCQSNKNLFKKYIYRV